MMTFRSRMLVAFCAVVMFVALAIWVSMEVFLRRNIIGQLEHHLDVTAEALRVQLETDEDHLLVQARVVAEEPRLRAVVTATEIDSQTQNEVAEALRRAVGWDVLALVDGEGTIDVLRGVLRTGETSVRVPSHILAGAGQHAGFWPMGARLYEVAAVPVRFGEDTSGTVVGGLVISDARAATYGRLHDVAVLFAGTHVYAMSFPFTDPRRPEAEQLAATASHTVRLAGERFLVRQVPLEPDLRLLVLRSEDAALRPYRRLQWTLAGAVVAALLIALGLGWFMARSLSKPVTDLVMLTVAVARGRLDFEIPPARGELGRLVESFRDMVREVDRSRDELKRAEALRRELEIARNIQGGVLPRTNVLHDFDLAARMTPATLVGGDFYDLIQAPNGSWLVIGDVSGHGLDAGLVMLMAQAAAHAAIVARPEASARDVLISTNRLLYENVKHRMGGDDYVTLVVIRHLGGGAFVAAGGHQPLFIVRESERVERLDALGPWCGLVPDLGEEAREFSFRLGPRDLLCLITDGIIEGCDASGEQFGEQRLVSCLLAKSGQPPQAVLDHLFTTVAAFTEEPSDDMTALLLQLKCNEPVGPCPCPSPPGSEPRELYLRVEPCSGVLDEIRHLVECFCSEAGLDGKRVEQVGIAAFELAQNAVSYSPDGKAEVRLHLAGEHHPLVLAVSNRIGPKQAKRLLDLARERDQWSSPLEYYVARMKSVAQDPDGKGLGWARIGYEANLVIKVAVADQVVTVTAQGAFKPGEDHDDAASTD